MEDANSKKANDLPSLAATNDKKAIALLRFDVNDDINPVALLLSEEDLEMSLNTFGKMSEGILLFIFCKPNSAALEKQLTVKALQQ